ncbi:hypothetical protein POVCU2_0095970 [Plasmodium ovale curtisi]|uniref:Uncharacterized protein n=1 Tax=Plasmodium ovale curtisi TaxID=864141 RepID=A0A1A8XDW8_PLAOA|nr:hypothetical protein POVCU2_0095970 [Plasmodium ovale curtisi]SBT02060.1 hypothetical protein POVCU1_072560 [Plasmodium ovale curtisi]
MDVGLSARNSSSENFKNPCININTVRKSTHRGNDNRSIKEDDKHFFLKQDCKKYSILCGQFKKKLTNDINYVNTSTINCLVDTYPNKENETEVCKNELQKNVTSFFLGGEYMGEKNKNIKVRCTQEGKGDYQIKKAKSFKKIIENTKVEMITFHEKNSSDITLLYCDNNLNQDTELSESMKFIKIFQNDFELCNLKSLKRKACNIYKHVDKMDDNMHYADDILKNNPRGRDDDAQKKRKKEILRKLITFKNYDPNMLINFKVNVEFLVPGGLII